MTFASSGLISKKQSSTLRARTTKPFTEWLKKRYATKEALLAAWGANTLNCYASEGFDGESWEEGPLVPAGNPLF